MKFIKDNYFTLTFRDQLYTSKTLAKRNKRTYVNSSTYMAFLKH